MTASSLTFTSFSILHPQRAQVKSGNQLSLICAARSKGKSNSRDGNRSGRQVWRRRKLTKKDDTLEYKMERIPFLEEKIRNIKDTGKLFIGDVDRLLLSEDNRFDFVNEIAAEATEYVNNNRDEYGAKKAIFHVISNRMNEMGFSRPEAYLESDPFSPGPGYVRDDLLIG